MLVLVVALLAESAHVDAVVVVGAVASRRQGRGRCRQGRRKVVAGRRKVVVSRRLVVVDPGHHRVTIVVNIGCRRRISLRKVLRMCHVKRC